MMSFSCRLCGQVFACQLSGKNGGLIVGGITDENRDALEYQASVVDFMQHMGKFHPDYITALAGTANTYHMHLVAKLIESSDEKFLAERETARHLVYWTMAGKFAIEDRVIEPKTPIAP